MRDRSLVMRGGLTCIVLVVACSSSAAPNAPIRSGPSAPVRRVEAPSRSNAETPAGSASETPTRDVPPPLGPRVELECAAWTSRTPAGATVSGSSCDDENGGDIDPATRVGVLGGASRYAVTLDGCEIFVELAGGGRPTPSAAAERTALRRSRFGFALSRLADPTDATAIIAVESTEHPELGLRARVSPIMPDAELARCRVVRDRIAMTLAHEAEWRGALRPADSRVVLHLGSETQRMELHLPDGYVARSTGVSVDVYQTHHVIQRWPPPPMRAVDDGSFGARELDRRLLSGEGAALDTAAPRLDIVTSDGGGFTLPHASRGEVVQVGAHRLRFAPVRDQSTMPSCTTATEITERRARFAITYFLCGAPDPALLEVLRSVRLVRAPAPPH